jgi:hypothetical protein
MDTSILYTIQRRRNTNHNTQLHRHKTDFTAIPTACPWEECSLEFAIPDQEDLLRKLLGDTVPDVATCSCSSTAIPSMEAAVDGTVDSSHAPTKDEEWEMFRSGE